MEVKGLAICIPVFAGFFLQFGYYIDISSSLIEVIENCIICMLKWTKENETLEV